MKSIIKALAGCVVLAAALAPATGRAACQVHFGELPVTMDGTRPKISAAINGKPVQLLVDTGAIASILSPAAAEELHLRLGSGPRGLVLKGVGGKFLARWTVVQQFELGGKISQRNVDFLVGGSSPGAAGVMGQNLWSRFDDEYDLADGVIRLSHPTGCEAVNLAYWDKTGRLSVFDQLSSSGTSGYAWVNGVRITVMFDSGAPRSALFFAAARRVGIDPRGPGSQPTGASSGFGPGKVQTRIAPVDLFQIGRENLEHTHLYVADTTLEGADMLLGADFFLSHRILVANSQKRIYFTYNGGPVFDLSPQLTSDSDAPPEPSPVGGAGPRPNVETPVGVATTAGREPQDASAYARRGEASLGRGEIGPAIADLTRAHELAPTTPTYLFQRGLAYRADHQVSLAMADFDAALRIQPDDVQARMARGEMRLAKGDKAGAVEDLDTADRQLAAQADERIALASLYARADAQGAAAGQYELWIKAHPQDGHRTAAEIGLCRTGGLSGQHLAEALTACDLLAKAAPKSAGALSNRALVRLRLGDENRAIADYDKALAVQPRLAAALYGRAVAEQRKGDTAAAKADFAAAASSDPQIADKARAIGIGGANP